MDITTLISFMDKEICGGPAGLDAVFGIIGYVVLGIKVAVPILLILFGMLDFAQAVMTQKDDQIKKAQKGLISKLIAAVAVFLIITIVTFLMGIIKDEAWKQCLSCVQHPTTCRISK